MSYKGRSAAITEGISRAPNRSMYYEVIKSRH